MIFIAKQWQQEKGSNLSRSFKPTIFCLLKFTSRKMRCACFIYTRSNCISTTLAHVLAIKCLNDVILAHRRPEIQKLSSLDQGL